MATDSVRITSILLKAWSPQKESELDLAVLQMATDIHRGASILAPKETRALVNSGKIKRNKRAHYTISFGDNRVPYARRRHFENKKTPGSLRYLERAGDSVARGTLTKYLRSV